jgi:hypothetical protein
MIEQQTNINFFHDPHGYFHVKKYFKGDYFRHIHVTIYDKKKDNSTLGYIYICTESVFLIIKKGISLLPGIYQLEPSDTLEMISGDNALLSKILNKTRRQYSVTSVTRNDKPLIVLNSKYILVTNIHPDSSISGSGMTIGALKTVYFNSKNDIEQTKNLIHTIQDISKNNTPDVSLLLPGITQKTSMANIYSAWIISYVVPIIFMIMAAWIVWDMIMYGIRNVNH